MPRQAKPTWDPDRNQFFALCGPRDARGEATRIRFPRVKETGEPVLEKDVVWAYQYRDRYVASLGSERQVREPGASAPARLVVEEHLADLEARAHRGRGPGVPPPRGPEPLQHPGRRPLEDESLLLDWPCSRLTPGDLTYVVRKFQRLGRSAHYIDGLCRTMIGAMNWATEPRHGQPAMLAENPFRGFQAPTLPVSAERFAERGVAARWLWYLRARANAYRPGSQGRRFARSLLHLVWMLIRTGARPGELCDLRWTDLRMEVRRTLAGHLLGRAQIPPGRWKTGKVRTIFRYPPLVRVLGRLASDPARHKTHVFVHGRGRGGKGAGEPWADGSGLAKTVARIRREMIADQAATRERLLAGDPVSAAAAWMATVQVQDEGPNRIVNYLWRHTAASTLIMLGIDLATVAEQLGTSVEMLRKHYGHLIDSHLQAAVKFAYGRRGA